jgi:hypothetical protein
MQVMSVSDAVSGWAMLCGGSITPHLVFPPARHEGPNSVEFGVLTVIILRVMDYLSNPLPAEVLRRLLFVRKHR